MDIHQIMQYTGQVMYILLKTFCAWIERLSGAIGAFLIGGEQVGKLSAVQPEGCLGYWTIASVLYDNRVICEAAVRSGNNMILHTESRLLAAARPSYHRVVVEGYGMAVAR